MKNNPVNLDFKQMLVDLDGFIEKGEKLKESFGVRNAASSERFESCYREIEKFLAVLNDIRNEVTDPEYLKEIDQVINKIYDLEKILTGSH